MSIDTQAESYFKERGLNLQPAVPYEKLAEEERPEWPHGFGLKVRGTREAIDRLLEEDGEHRMPTYPYMDYLKHWGAIVLKGSSGMAFFAREGARRFNPESDTPSFRLHKDSSMATGGMLGIQDIEAFEREASQEDSPLKKGILTLARHPMWTEGVNFWAPETLRPQANTLIVPDQSFHRALESLIPDTTKQELRERAAWVQGVFPELPVELLEKRLFVDFYTCFMDQDKARSMTRKSKTLHARIDQAITELCKSQITVRYDEPTIATWFEPSVVHKAVATGVRAESPTICNGISYARHKRIYY